MGIGLQREQSIVGEKDGDSPSGKSDVHFCPINNDDASSSSSSLLVTVQKAMEYPLYYIRHYGPRNENRVESQLTYMGSVKFPKRHSEIEWHLDEEVADRRWMSLDDVAEWLSNDVRKMGKDESKQNTGNDALVEMETVKDNDDEGPDWGDFCHGTVRSLYEVGLRNIREHMSI